MRWYPCTDGSYMYQGGNVYARTVRTVEPFDPAAEFELPVPADAADGSWLGQVFVLDLDGVPTKSRWAALLIADNGKGTIHAEAPLPAMRSAHVSMTLTYKPLEDYSI